MKPIPTEKNQAAMERSLEHSEGALFASGKIRAADRGVGIVSAEGSAASASIQGRDVPVEHATTLLEWNAPEFIQHAKGRVWFIVSAMAIGALVVDAIWTGSWTMAIAFIVLAGVYILAHHRAPAEVKVKITDFDIRVGNRSIPYNEIKAFWILYNPPGLKTLKLLTSDKLMSELSIQLDGQAPGPVRVALLKHIPEYEGKRESFVEFLIRAFKL